MSDLTALAPPPAGARRTEAAFVRAPRVRPALLSIGRWLAARLDAYSRRQVALALGERVGELNQAIRAGAAARHRLAIHEEDAK